MTFIASIKTVIVWSTLITHILLAALMLLWIVSLWKPRLKRVKKQVFAWITQHALWIGLFFVTAATAGSLFYSEIAKYTPCDLCWWQRIFMYPQVLIFGLALKKKLDVWPIVRWMSIIGGLVALVHYATQWQSNATSCIAGDPACLAKYVFQFGYITIPLMALTVFALVLFLSCYHKK